jgi:tripartite motif-containing protein 71
MVIQFAAGRVYDYSHSVGRQGQSGVGFSNPVGIAVGAGDTVYVLSRGSETTSNVHWSETGTGARVGKLTIGTTPGDEELLSDFGSYGIGDGQLIWPSGIVIDHGGNIYVTDEWLNRVSVFDRDGAFLRRWSTVDERDEGNHGTSGIGIDGAGNIYVADGRSHQISKFRDDGRLLTRWGKKGSGLGDLDSPWGITVDDEGYVYVADHRNHRVQKYTATGEFVAEFGGPSNRHGRLHLPTGVAVDPDGDVYVCDWGENDYHPGRVLIYAANGRYITKLIGDAQQLSKWAQQAIDANPDYARARRRAHHVESEWRFALPTGIMFDAVKGRLFVVDCQRSRLQVYNKPKDYQEPQVNA